MPVELWEHQREALMRSAGRKYYALFFEQGCGKTATAIHFYWQKCAEAGCALRALIFCPPIVISNWGREFREHMPQAVVRELTGPGTRRANKLTLFNNGAYRVAVTNYESVLIPSFFTAVKAWKPEVLILDESHKVKDPASKRTKAITELATTIEYRMLLTGTPCPNSLEDIFSQFRILDGGETFGNNFIRFREEFFTNKNAWQRSRFAYPNWQPKKGAEEEIQRRMAPSAMRVAKSECLSLPPLVRQYIDVDLTSEQRRAYESMERHGVVRLPEGKVASADLAITKAVRLQQLASGFVQADDGSIKRFFPNKRAETLREVIESFPKKAKFIVWAVYRENYLDIRHVLDEMRIQYVELTGEVPHIKRAENIACFRENLLCRAVIGNPQAAGIGINLVEAEYSIFYSRGFSLESDMQAEARNHRGGSEIHQQVVRIDLVARGTIDEVVLLALKEKKDVQAALLEHLNQARGNKPWVTRTNQSLR
jgi:SNF2 family DNA or RNA helicase